MPLVSRLTGVLFHVSSDSRHDGLELFSVQDAMCGSNDWASPAL